MWLYILIFHQMHKSHIQLSDMHKTLTPRSPEWKPHGGTLYNLENYLTLKQIRNFKYILSMIFLSLQGSLCCLQARHWKVILALLNVEPEASLFSSGNSIILHTSAWTSFVTRWRSRRRSGGRSGRFSSTPSVATQHSWRTDTWISYSCAPCTSSARWDFLIICQLHCPQTVPNLIS